MERSEGKEERLSVGGRKKREEIDKTKSNAEVRRPEKSRVGVAAATMLSVPDLPFSKAVITCGRSSQMQTFMTFCFCSAAPSP